MKIDTLHTTPADLNSMIRSEPEIQKIWNTITPLAQNEWICWITSAKKAETRARRLSVAKSKLKSGMRRPCCWQGCPHR